MASKSEVNEMVIVLFGERRFAELWWDLKLPGLGNATPAQIWEKDPQQVVDYVNKYYSTEGYDGTLSNRG